MTLPKDPRSPATREKNQNRHNKERAFVSVLVFDLLNTPIEQNTLLIASGGKLLVARRGHPFLFRGQPRKDDPTLRHWRRFFASSPRFGDGDGRSQAAACCWRRHYRRRVLSSSSAAAVSFRLWCVVVVIHHRFPRRKASPLSIRTTKEDTHNNNGNIVIFVKSAIQGPRRTANRHVSSTSILARMTK